MNIDKHRFERLPTQSALYISIYFLFTNKVIYFQSQLAFNSGENASRPLEILLCLPKQFGGNWILHAWIYINILQLNLVWFETFLTISKRARCLIYAGRYVCLPADKIEMDSVYWQKKSLWILPQPLMWEILPCMQKHSITLQAFLLKGNGGVCGEGVYHLHFYISPIVNALGALGRPVQSRCQAISLSVLLQ